VTAWALHTRPWTTAVLPLRGLNRRERAGSDRSKTSYVADFVIFLGIGRRTVRERSTRNFPRKSAILRLTTFFRRINREIAINFPPTDDLGSPFYRSFVSSDAINLRYINM